MGRRGTPVGAFAAVLLAASGPGFEGKGADPWDIPPPDYAGISITITMSKQSYELYLAGKVPAEALQPERVDPPATPEQRKAIESCRALLAAEKWPEAEAALRELLGKGPALHDARALLGVALLRQKKAAEAAAALRESLIGNRRNPEAWKALEETAAALGKKVVRPVLAPRGWVLIKKDGDVQVGHADSDKDSDFGWSYYAAAYPGKEYRFTFREQLFAAAAAAHWAEDTKKDGEKVADDLARLAAERKAKTLAPFVFFAMYPEPLPAEAEKDFETLRPRLEKYFDERILVKR